MNKNLQRLAEPGGRLYLIFLVLFAAAALFFKMYELAVAEGVIILILMIYSFFSRRRRAKQLESYIESVTYDTENAKNNTLMNFPLPIAAFRLDDSRIIWGNEMFFAMSGSSGTRLDVRVSDLVPEFNGKWLLEGKTQYPSLLTVNGRKYQIHGNIIRSEDGDDSAFMGITYWVDMTEYDDIRMEYENSRPVACVLVIDNMDELVKNQPDRIKNDIRDAIEDKLNKWCDDNKAIIRRYERDRYLILFESRCLEQLKAEKFSIIQEVHQVESPTGIDASISLGLGVDASSLAEALQYATVAIELALSRGGDQAVIKNRLSFEFFGGRGSEVEKRTKVKSRVMANTLAELVRDSSKVLVMGHKLVVVDTNRPEQVEDADLLMACNRVAVIDHHRVAATYIHNAALGFIEPYASSAGELMTEVLQEVVDQNDILRCEAEALLAGIVLDTKSFTIRTGERTFDAAAYLRRAGADTTDVKKLLQTDMDDTVAKYKILQSAKLYRNLAIAVPEEPQNRVVAASAADELLNISGVDASIVVAPDGNGGSFASARSIGELNVQLIMEKVGGGGNRSAAAAQFAGTDVNTAVKRIYAAIDDYLG